MKIRINRMHNTVPVPKRGHYNDAGADVYSPVGKIVPAGGTVKIPLGFGLEIPNGYYGCVYTRSSMAAKGLACEMPPIDSGYRGEIHAVITNHGSEEYIIHQGDRIGQLLIQPVILADFVENLGDEREEGAFGSTGR